MRTISEILKGLEDEGLTPDEIQQQSVKIMKDSISTKLKLQGPPAPQVLAGLNTDHILALFRWLLDVVLAQADDKERQDAWEAFTQYRDWDITARHYEAYVRANEDS